MTEIHSLEALLRSLYRKPKGNHNNRDQLPAHNSWLAGKKKSPLQIQTNKETVQNAYQTTETYRSEGDSRSQVIRITCSQQLTNNQTQYIPNFVKTMEKISTQIQTTHQGTALTGTGDNSNYGLAECYGDLSTEDCILCYAEARTVLPSCFPNNGGQIFLDGCFMRTENYFFYEEYAGADDTVICGNTTMFGGSLDSAKQAISDAARDAPRNRDYFARKVAFSGTTNESTYVLADCWGTLNESSCSKCLEKASASIFRCLPWSEGRALHTGCFMRYSTTNFLNADPTRGNNGAGNAKSQVVQRNCQNQVLNNGTKFTQNFIQAMADISSKMRTSQFGTVVTGTAPDRTYGLAQCYGDLSTGECNLCYAVASSSLPGCLPSNGGRVYLTGCFMRYENYSFFEEHTGQEDRVICVNKTRRNNDFEQSASKAVFQTVEAAPKSKEYHAGKQALISGTANKSVYAMADCWRTLDTDSCAYCLQKAATSMLGCLPESEGYALYAGCFIKYSDSNFLYPDDHKTLSKGKIIAIVMAVTSALVFLIASIIAFYAWKHRNKSKRRRQGSDDTPLLMMVNNSNLNFKYSIIEKATGSFDEVNKLGQGGFGTVYKGVLPDGREIAAKRLFFNQRHRTGDFYHEVNIISSVDHKNLVKLVGFSCLGPESILIYEYLPNKSLNYFIFDAVRGKELNWAKRFDIIVGIAEGLAYLHENTRSFQEDKNHISTGIAGTLGYMAPEYVLNEEHKHQMTLTACLQLHGGIFQQGTVDELFDPNLMLKDDTSSSMKKEIRSVIQIGLLCTQEVPSLRPTMSMTLQMLSKNIVPLPSPSNPPCIPETDTESNEFGQIPAFRHRLNNPASLPTVTHTSFSPR
ncbi:unnamed protein product [Lactuca virosa]|uniref:Cysteine-rich receptor-like protein kinase 2 n=1 Tax=Lactuca virosa TaxID=75947 RepID=A0AAU9LKN8_9ASTR|nr:unnamed protein product [Lactuca virosa]